MKPVLVTLSVLAGIGVLAAACDDGGPRHRHHHRGSSPSACSVHTSCGTCTPVLGCGWCFTQAGGTCVSDPDACPRGTAAFAWEPSYCGPVDAGGDAARVTADASLGLPDASVAPAVEDATAPNEDAAIVDADVADAPDAD